MILDDAEMLFLVNIVYKKNSLKLSSLNFEGDDRGGSKNCEKGVLCSPDQPL